MPSANDRFKDRFATAYWTSVGAAVVLHFLLFTFGPAFAVDRFDRDPDAPMVVQPAEVDLPPPPAAVQRPATPVVSDAVMDDALTIPSVIFERYVPAAPPAPPSALTDDDARSRFESFVPSMTAPRVLNPAQVERVLQERYPRVLRDAGIGGRVEVELWLDEHGAIVRSRVASSSGYPAMDEAALAVIDVMRLAPAMNRGRAVRVVVSLPVQFSVR